MSSPTYELFASAMVHRKQVVCMYEGYARELCPIVLGHSGGLEKALTYQFAGKSRSGLPPGGEWRCLFLSKVANAQLRAGPWHTGASHMQPQGCVESVDLDVNPHSPYSPKRRAIDLSASPLTLGRVADVAVRQIHTTDQRLWAQLRMALWPEETAEAHAKWIDDYLQGDALWAFVAEAGDMPIGFAEVSVRKYANGCETAPVPFLEGIWVKEEFRRQRVGARLMEHVEAFLKARGYVELGSDALLNNPTSHAAHTRWGFSETERVVYFRKRLEK